MNYVRCCHQRCGNGHVLCKRRSTVKIAMRKAAEVLVVTADLYRELTLSALRLVPGRR